MTKSGKRNSRTRADGRRPLLVYMETETVKDLKRAALDQDRNAYEIVEEAVRRWLAARTTKAARNPKK
jgi:hypothetical protein